MMIKGDQGSIGEGKIKKREWEGTGSCRV